MATPIIMKILLWAAYLISLFFAIFWFLVLLEKEPKQKTRKISKLPFVTIVVPAYNEEKNIVLSLESLTKINYPKNRFEVIIVNDGSKDRTSEHVKKFIAENRHHIFTLIDKKNQGKGAALNDGLKIAKGEFFVCLDADSIVTKNALTKILPYFADDEIAAVLPMMKVHKPKNILQRMQWVEYIVNMFYKSLMSRLNCVHVAPGPFSVYRASILKKVGGFDEDNITEDMEITLRLQSRHYRIVQLMHPEVYTIAPKNFRELYKQRNRWFKGSIINSIKYNNMIFNRKYGDFGFIQMPTVLISGIIAIILFVSIAYYSIKPYAKALYNSIFIDFDIYTLIKNFNFDFHILDINFMAVLVAFVMLIITGFVLKKSHERAKEAPSKHGFFSLLSYVFFYFLFIGFVWIGILFDFAFKRKQKW